MLLWGQKELDRGAGRRERKKMGGDARRITYECARDYRQGWSGEEG